MMKSTILLLLCMSTLFTGCDDDESIGRPPASKYRVQAMSHGETHYSLLKYDEDGRISEVIHGTIDEALDSVESVFRVSYRGDLIDEIANRADNHTFRYSYTKGKLNQSREYKDGKLLMANDFYYDEAGHVDLWVTKQASEDDLVSVERKFYQYDASGNAVSMELETYDPVTRGHTLTSTSKFLDFDDKNNSGSLFLNFSNPYHTQFKNNARTWRVELTNGSAGETHYEYQYNDEGYATVQRDLQGELEIRYKFAQY